MKLTLLQVQKQLPQGISVVRKDGEYIVRFKGMELIKRFGIGTNPEDYTYYTDDLSDALGTAHAMANHTGNRNSTKLMQRVEDSNAGKLGYNETNQLIADLDTAIQAKRGRGRPRKVVELVEEPVIKRGRGRPRKVVDAKEEYEALRDVWGDNDPKTRKALEQYRNTIPVKRGPGRPRKVVPEASKKEPMEITSPMLLNLLKAKTVGILDITGNKVMVMEPQSGSVFVSKVSAGDWKRLQVLL